MAAGSGERMLSESDTSSLGGVVRGCSRPAWEAATAAGEKGRPMGKANAELQRGGESVSSCFFLGIAAVGSDSRLPSSKMRRGQRGNAKREGGGDGVQGFGRSGSCDANRIAYGLLRHLRDDGRPTRHDGRDTGCPFWVVLCLLFSGLSSTREDQIMGGREIRLVVQSIVRYKTRED